MEVCPEEGINGFSSVWLSSPGTLSRPQSQIRPASAIFYWSTPAFRPDTPYSPPQDPLLLICLFLEGMIILSALFIYWIIYTELYVKWHYYVRKILIDLHILLKIKKKVSWHVFIYFSVNGLGGVASRRRDLQLQGRDKNTLSYHTVILQLTWYISTLILFS